MKTKSIFLRISFIICLSFFTISCENNVEEEMITLEETTNGNNNGNNSGNGNNNGNGNNGSSTSITFSKTIQPIISNNCLPCHGNGATSPNLTSYNNISRSANSVKNAVVSRRMPRGGSLSQTEIDAIASWVDGGAPNN